MQTSVTLKDIYNTGACATRKFCPGEGWLEKLHPLQVLLPLEFDLVKSSSPAIKRKLFMICKERDVQKSKILT